MCWKENMERYSVIREKNPREIVLLRGRGCVYKKCAFCDYYLDASSDPEANFALNALVLEKVTGEWGDLEVINSGSVFELDEKTLSLIREICLGRGIGTLHFESHYLYRERIDDLRRFFAPIRLKMKLGLETFDRDYRENVLKKGISESSPSVIGEHFQEANLLFGLPGQTPESMERDISLGLEHFERICVNIMCPNTAPLQPDQSVVDAFMQTVYPRYRDDERVDILISNTDFGVGD